MERSGSFLEAVESGHSKMALTAALGAFLERIRFEDLPDDAVALARDAFTDTIGVMMAGVGEPVVNILYEELSGKPMAGQTRAVLSSTRISAVEAALISGTAAHALDYDDQSLTGHPSAVLVPAILAEGEHLRSSGKEMVTAYVAGYEVWAELVRRSANYHRKGWHPTSVFGVVGASAAASVLRRLAADRAVAALAIAASHAGGLAVNFGTMTKPFHAGLAARDGVFSARLASAGATASKDTFENRQGFLTAFSPDASADWDSPARLGEDWHLVRHRLCVKRYPTCYFMHRSFDATVKMLEGRGLRPEDIAGITVTMGAGQTAVLVNERPQTGLEAKFSEQFAMAAAVVLGTMGIDDLRDEVVQRPEIQAFFPKVRINAVDEYDERDPAHSPSESVAVTLTDGSVLDTGPIVSIRGHAYDPLTAEELWAKFRDCTSKTHTDAEARLLFDRSQSIVDLNSALDLPTCERVFQAECLAAE
ncbi:MmgE/PrpD family protein [Sinorhizobium meliloti]|nr:MmgE/PrpD family protein [Sinorhizobium meliloti]MDW9835952.1 MmgE/PrpD family protein [Sinorhizobium meliloti]MDX0040359.1 MmgE/PrpD family protein [Sinorhizobium meliloti]MDX0088881.1 MmgE/PrpD family protein [Sinorhizobium meliloti]MQX63421.1 MmgE/PrpD family protein [Sinorhizobium meliloti]